MPHPLKDVVRKIYMEVLNHGRFELVPQLYCADCVSYDPANRHELRGLDAVVELMEYYWVSFPGHRYEIHEMIAEGDTVVVRWTVHLPMPPDGHEVAVSGMKMCRFRDGKVHRIWQHYDNHTLMEELARYGGRQPRGLSVPEAVDRALHY